MRHRAIGMNYASIKKCLVLDLDNTLWGGVIGEDGIGGIKLGLTPPGSFFLAFQQAVLDLSDRGIILAISSKNNYEDAIEVIEKHPNMILKKNNFSAMRINWNDKAENIREMARELNIGLDSMVFLDDNPAERLAVSSTIPEVEVPELPADPKDYASFLINLPYFEKNIITDEDKMRGSMYVTERLRKKEEENYKSKDEYLKALGVQVLFYVNDKSAVSRLAQLTEKTNQFNSNKMPLTEDEILALMKNKNARVVHISASDRFGDYGIIGLAIIKIKGEEWNIESLLMSCRALDRGIEEVFLGAMGKTAKDEGVKKISVEFRKTDKNKPAEDFISKYLPDGSLPVDNAENIMPSRVKLIYK